MAQWRAHNWKNKTDMAMQVKVFVAINNAHESWWWQITLIGLNLNLGTFTGFFFVEDLQEVIGTSNL